ncbi:glycosyltransferase [Photobacterium sp. NCIMB 13483]|uniref:glycosyltransferase family 2 protein n=1 Tax=Photobacterium sp. NCIMB 13483 TaxID=2022103 RepID=UPI00130485E6|nr:glycosyltransferase [Photobacterium sp. NCIMB 13483]
MNKLVSVIVPVYNGEKHVELALLSIINQTYKNLEIIVVNDGSTDNTSLIINRISAEDKRVKIFNRNNCGLIDTLNFGLENCSGDYIARMDSDDISYPTRIQKQLEFLEKNNNVVICGTQFEMFGVNVGISNLPISNEMCKLQLNFSTPFCHPTTMFRKTRLKYNKYYIHSEDYKFWVDLSKYGDFANLNEVLLKYRTHEKQVSKKYNTIQITNQVKISNEKIGSENGKYKDEIKKILKIKYSPEEANILNKNICYLIPFVSVSLLFPYFTFAKNNNIKINEKKILILILRCIKWLRLKVI